MDGDKTWHEDDTFWQETLPILFTQRRIEEAGKEIEQLLRLAEIPGGSAVLDLCCGIGRHSLELARRGFRVTGVDRTRAYLDLAAAAAEREGLHVELVLEERKVEKSWSWIQSRWTLISGRRRVDLDLSHRLYAASELVSLLRGCGFREAVAYGDLEGSPYDEKADRLVVVAGKE
jgi:SAM-dependent methyltransferase